MSTSHAHSTSAPPPIAVPGTVGARPTPSSHLRIARPSRSLSASERFWVTGLGLSVLWRSGPPAEVEGGHALLMLGFPGAAWHLELVGVGGHDGQPGGEGLQPRSTEEDLLVLYVDGPVEAGVVEGLVEAGGKRVVSRNPYWETWGVTVEDPDGYRVVLCQRSWANQ